MLCPCNLPSPPLLSGALSFVTSAFSFFLSAEIGVHFPFGVTVASYLRELSTNLLQIMGRGFAGRRARGSPNKRRSKLSFSPRALRGRGVGEREHVMPHRADANRRQDRWNRLKNAGLRGG